MDMPIQRAGLFGKPHIGNVRYSGDRIINLDYPICQICGRRGNNNHHLAPKGMGGGSKYLDVAGRKLQSSLITVCGSGNASGCHGKFHDGLIIPEWKWFKPEYQVQWDTGELFEQGFEPYSEDLYRLGYWSLDIMGQIREIYG